MRKVLELGNIRSESIVGIILQDVRIDFGSLENSILQGACIERCQVEGLQAYETTMTECSVREVVLYSCYFDLCRFEDCDFTLTKFEGATLTNCSFTRCVFPDISIMPDKLGKDADFRDSIFTAVDISEFNKVRLRKRGAQFFG